MVKEAWASDSSSIIWGRSLPRRRSGGCRRRADEVGNHHRDGPMRRHPQQELQRAVQIRPAMARLEEQHLADDAQHVPAAFARRDELLDLVGEQDQPDLVVVADGGEGQHRGDLGRQLALGLRVRAEQARAADVHHQHQRQLAFLDELLDERMVHPRGDVPVDRADLVAGLVFAHLVEVHPLALEDAVVLAGQRLAHQPVGANLDLPDLLEDLAGNHGTGSSSKIFWMTISLVFSSASAS